MRTSRSPVAFVSAAKTEASLPGQERARTFDVSSGPNVGSRALIRSVGVEPFFISMICVNLLAANRATLLS